MSHIEQFNFIVSMLKCYNGLAGDVFVSNLILLSVFISYV